MTRTQWPHPSIPSLVTSRRALFVGASGLVLLAACGNDDSPSGRSGGAGQSSAGPLRISAIPDQDPEVLNRLYGDVAARFAEATGMEVTYTPVTEYPAVVRGFEVGDIAIAWMGGLTGVQAAQRVDGATAFAQRDIDAEFTSLFIATKKSGLAAFDAIDGLSELAGHSLTFGSETSTSGRLMPQYFMDQAGLSIEDLKGQPGYSGSHDATIEAVASGSFEVGAVNEQVWTATVEAGEVDLSDVVVLFRTPAYYDYHWLARPDIDDAYGAGTLDKVKDMLFGLDPSVPDDAAILDLFGAASFVPTENDNYDQIRKVAEELGLLA
ncbi:putative selenate ABC transporter substrate-binding protein [Nocardioides sp.]|uniref:putative selenate ABC transporter substrate-binding protein n=1 Tax=Nocardioides sp. TaxID=35761 RepID=UPI002CE21920|nr:putative selenate ABC transporter substrate-binding protein [Nocardioides sp.]HXH79286.1 putative selenate ABC transporter substrate-binding protein [Nocardioides sp.]